MLHRDTGHWGKSVYDQACFNNRDYKETRLHSDTFLEEKPSPPEALMDVFTSSGVHVFRAVDVDLRKQYHARVCNPKLSEDKYSACLAVKGEGLGTTTHLARLLFDMEAEEKQKKTRSPTY